MAAAYTTSASEDFKIPDRGTDKLLLIFIRCLQWRQAVLGALEKFCLWAPAPLSTFPPLESLRPLFFSRPEKIFPCFYLISQTIMCCECYPDEKVGRVYFLCKNFGPVVMRSLNRWTGVLLVVRYRNDGIVHCVRYRRTHERAAHTSVSTSTVHQLRRLLHRITSLRDTQRETLLLLLLLWSDRCPCPPSARAPCRSAQERFPFPVDTRTVHGD